MLDLVGLPVSDHNVGFTSQYGPDQIADTIARILVVAIGVDHDVCPHLQRLRDPVVEGPAETHVPGMADNVMDPKLSGDRTGTVPRPVVDDEELEAVDTRKRSRHTLEHEGQRLLLV